MPFTQEAALRQAINECTVFEGKYYLWRLLDSLVSSNRSAAELDPIAGHMRAIIRDINYIKTLRSNQTDALNTSIQELSNHYQALVRETQAGGVFYYSRQFLLGLGGVILGTITAVLCGTTGFFVGFFRDVINKKVPTAAVFGAIAGAMVGAAVGYRIPDKLFKNPEHRAIQYSVRRLKATFDSFLFSVREDAVNQITQDILVHRFHNNEQAFERCFLNIEIPYEILTADAGLVLSKKVQGFLGHHSWIAFTIPGDVQPRRIESGEEMPIDYSTNSADITQRESIPRQATGRKLIEMLVLHQVLAPIYVLKTTPRDLVNPQNVKNLLTFQYRFKPGVDDCYTYIDRILQAVGERPLGETKRFAANDGGTSLLIRDALRFLSPLPERSITLDSDAEDVTLRR